MVPFVRLLAALPLVSAMVLTPAAATVRTTADPSHRPTGVIVWTHRATDAEHLMIADPDGQHARTLTTPRAGSYDIDAQISPNGRWVLYTRNQNGLSQLRLVQPDGTDDHALDVACTGSCLELSTPTWLSDRRVAFSLVLGPVDEGTGYAASSVLYTASIDGGHVRRWSRPGIERSTEENALRPSPDGRYVTLRVSRLSDGGSALFRAAPDGSRRHQLTPWALKADVYDLSTARRGRTADLVVFESFGRGTSDETFVDLATVPATCPTLRACTAALTWLTDNAATGRRNANPQWSPNGKRLVFTDRPNFTDQNADIFQARYPLRHRQQVSTAPEFDYRPAWGPSPCPDR